MTQGYRKPDSKLPRALVTRELSSAFASLAPPVAARRRLVE
jgi:hypothetical protein